MPSDAIDVDRILSENPDIVDDLQFVCLNGGKYAPVPISVTAAIYHLAKRIDPDTAKKFTLEFLSGIGVHEGSPVLALNRRLRNGQKRYSGGDRRERPALMIKAWNSYRKNRSVFMITFSSKEDFPALQ